MNIQIVIYFSILFLFSELGLMFLKRSDKNSTKKQNDRKSLLVFWLVIPLSITFGFMLASYQHWTQYNIFIAYFGLTVFVVGIVIRWLSILQLKKDFTVDVAITETHRLQTGGMYKKIRHPSYFGLLLIAIGLSIAMNSFTSIVVMIVPFYFAIMYRIKIEEEILVNEFGDVYAEYMSKTNKVFPF